MGTTIAYCPHVRKSGHLTQSVVSFSSSHVWGTMENPIWMKYAGACVNAQSFSKPSRRARRRSSSTIIVPTPCPRSRRSTARERTSATCGLSAASSAQPTIRRPRVATTNRVACTASSPSVRGSRWPSARLAEMRACRLRASESFAERSVTRPRGFIDQLPRQRTPHRDGRALRRSPFR